jgi:lipase
VLARDLRGHGRSDWEPPWSLESHVADVLAAMDEAGIDRADLVGHSFGGRIALELLAASPARVRRLVLLDPAIWVPPPIALERAELNRVPPAFRSRAEALAARIATDLHHTPMDMLEEELDDHLVSGEDGLLRYRYAASAVVAAYGEMASRPPAWDRLQAPTLLVRGVESEVVPEAVVGLVRDGLGDRVEIVDVPGGHNVTWDAFEETAAAITRFLEDPRA